MFTDKLAVGEKSFYHKNILRDGKYLSVGYLETIEASADVEHVDPSKTATVTHTGGYGQIKFIYDGIEWTSPNPFSNYFDRLEDGRTAEWRKGRTDLIPYIATNTNSSRALDMQNLQFDLTPEFMASMHHEIYCKQPKENKEFWVDVRSVSEAA
jgi:hypothetical protein